MKKILSLLLGLVILLAGCDNKETLYILNCGEYIETELIEQFEVEYDVKVILEEVSSNEDMYTQVKSNTTRYDIIIPSDYMVEKMINEDMLTEIDKSKISNKPNYFQEVLDLQKIYDSELKYSIPYFWGNIGLMYDLSVENQVIVNGWKVLFEEVTGINKVGMHNSSRDAVASALLYLNLDPNSTLDSDLTLAQAALKQLEYEAFGEEDLKTEVLSGNLDVALVYSRDYIDQLYLLREADEEATFGFFVPKNTNVWIANLAIPKNSKNTELAYKFIDFALNKDNAYKNVNNVGYCPVDKRVYEIMRNTEVGWEGIIDHPYYYPLKDGIEYIYRDLGEEHYQKLDDILINVKG